MRPEMEDIVQEKIAALSMRDKDVLCQVTPWGKHEGHYASVGYIATKAGLRSSLARRCLKRLRDADLISLIYLYDEDTHRTLGSAWMRTYTGQCTVESFDA